MSTITRIRPEGGHIESEEPIEAFFARRGRRARAHLPPFTLTHDELLADLDPGCLVWRAAGCPADERQALPALGSAAGAVRAVAG